MKKKFDFESLMEDWIIPLGIIAVVIWFILQIR